MTQLTDEDVRAILKVLETSPFDDLELETPEFRLSLHRTIDGGWVRESTTQGPVNRMQPSDPAPSSDSESTAARVDDFAATASLRGIAPNLLDVRSPLPGTFYRSPKPGSPPFVEIGSSVDKETVVGIVETMKLMNSIHAGVRGRIAQICLADAAFANQEAVLMRIEADTP